MFSLMHLVSGIAYVHSVKAKYMFSLDSSLMMFRMLEALRAGMQKMNYSTMMLKKHVGNQLCFENSIREVTIISFLGVVMPLLHL